jgi:hypothetical protein
MASKRPCKEYLGFGIESRVKLCFYPKFPGMWVEMVYGDQRPFELPVPRRGNLKLDFLSPLPTGESTTEVGVRHELRIRRITYQAKTSSDFPP